MVSQYLVVSCWPRDFRSRKQAFHFPLAPSKVPPKRARSKTSSSARSSPSGTCARPLSQVVFRARARAKGISCLPWPVSTAWIVSDPGIGTARRHRPDFSPVVVTVLRSSWSNFMGGDSFLKGGMASWNHVTFLRHSRFLQYFKYFQIFTSFWKNFSSWKIINI